MTIKTNRAHQDLEASGEDELTLVVVRYTGDQSVYNASAIRQQGGWPATSGFNSGVAEIALVPSKRLGFWERHADFEIDYDDASLAEAFLDKNYLAPQVFGANVDVGLRDRVLDQLGINVQRNAEAYREELADVAGVGVEPGEEADPHERRESDFADAKRSTLQRAADAHGMDDTDSAGREALTEYLADQDDDDVDATIKSIQSGESVPDDAGGEPSTLDKGEPDRGDEVTDDDARNKNAVDSAVDDSADEGETAEPDASNHPDRYESIEDLDGVGGAKADDLREGGYGSIADLEAAELETLADVDGVGTTLASDIHDQLDYSGVN